MCIRDSLSTYAAAVATVALEVLFGLVGVAVASTLVVFMLSLIHISEPTRRTTRARACVAVRRLPRWSWT